MITQLLIDRGRNIREALHQLEETERKTLFVVSDNRQLFGTLTDGDIRRWILGGGSLDGAVGDVCNRQPFYTHADYSRDKIRQRMLELQINSVPILSSTGVVEDVLLWEQIFGDQAPPKPTQPIRLPVVVMAGGKGTRLAPFTSVLPKPLIPVGGKTALEVIMNSFADCGVDEFYISVNYKSRLIQAYFEELAPPYQVHYVYEDEPLGTAGSLRFLAGRVNGDLIVINCDVIIKADYHTLVEHHRRQENDITLVVSLKNYSIPYGICELDSDGRLTHMKEKPEYNFLVNTGLYVLNAAVLDEIPENRFFHITELIEKIRQQGGRIGVYPISDKAWLDTGEWHEYVQTLTQLGFDTAKGDS